MPSPLKLSGSSPLSGGPSIVGTPQDAEDGPRTFFPRILDQSLDTQLEFGYDDSSFLTAGTGIGVNTQGPQDKDPFISNRMKGEQKLSPTASDFQPYALRLTPQELSYPLVVSNRLQPTKAQASIHAPSGISASLSATASSMVSDPISPTSSEGSSGVTQLGTFSTDTIVTRALMIRSISGMYSPVTITLVESCVNVSNGILVDENALQMPSSFSKSSLYTDYFGLYALDCHTPLYFGITGLNVIAAPSWTSRI